MDNAGSIYGRASSSRQGLKDDLQPYDSDDSYDSDDRVGLYGYRCASDHTRFAAPSPPPHRQAPRLPRAHQTPYPENDIPKANCAFRHDRFMEPPRPPHLQAPSLSRAHQTSLVEDNPDNVPVNQYSPWNSNHQPKPSTSSWIPPPPPPPLGIPKTYGPNVTKPSLETTFQSPISTHGSAPASSTTPQTSAYSYNLRETIHQAHHSPTTNSPTFTSHNRTSLYIPNQTLKHVVSPVNYNTQFNPGPSHLNPFSISSNDQVYFQPHTFSHPYPPPPLTTTTTTTNDNMLLTRTSTPFERGPFAAPSIPPQHVLLQTRTKIQGQPQTQPHALSPSFPSPSNSNLTPPPRPPKPPELELEYIPTPISPNPTTSTSSSTSAPPPPIPERINHEQNNATMMMAVAPSPPPLPPSIHLNHNRDRDILDQAVSTERDGVPLGGIKSPIPMPPSISLAAPAAPAAPASASPINGLGLPSTPGTETLSSVRLDVKNPGTGTARGGGAEDVNASTNSNSHITSITSNGSKKASNKVASDAGSGDKVFGSDLPATSEAPSSPVAPNIAAAPSSQTLTPTTRQARVTDNANGDGHTDTFASAAASSEASVDGPDSSENSTLSSSGRGGLGDGRVYDAGDDGQGNNEQPQQRHQRHHQEREEREEEEQLGDVQSDSGMTMDQYDPGAFDFPRRVNEGMVHVLSPPTPTLAFPSSILHGGETLNGTDATSTALTTNANTTTTANNNTSTITQSSSEDASNGQHLVMEIEGEAPPTYDEVELEARLIHSQTPTSPTAPAPPSTSPSSAGTPLAPPPAFRPQTPSTCTSSGEATAREQSQTGGGYGHGNINAPGSFTSHTIPHPQNSGKRSSRQAPPPHAQDDLNGNRARSTSDSSSGYGHDGLMMTSRNDGSESSSRPAIYTSPPTPSPGHSPSNSITRSATYLRSLRISVPRRFTTGGGGGGANGGGGGGGEGDSLGSRSPTSEASDPFLDPPTFQVDNSPFSLTQSGINDSPRSIPADLHPHLNNNHHLPHHSNSPSQSRSPISDNTQQGGTFGRSSTDKGRSRSYSGFWSNVSSTPPTPKSDLATHEAGRRPYDDSPSTSTPQAVVNVDSPKTKRRSTLGRDGSRLSLFFKSPGNGTNASNGSGNGSMGGNNGNGNASAYSGRNPNVQIGASRVRAGGVDLLDDGAMGEMWHEAWRRTPSPTVGLADPVRGASGDGGGSGEEMEQSALMDLWEGIEFGFCAPGWNSTPAPGPYSNPTEWPDALTLYPVGSKPFFVRAPTWRSLLRFLASQSTLRIEPSVEALATSRTPTIDLRLVVQFARTPFTPRGTSRDVCLYMMLHTTMPSTATRAGRALPAEDRAALENWDTRALPYGFVCAEGGLLARHGVTAARPNIAAGASELRGTPIADQDPDGEDSMFITIPPPFIELPVKMSDIAMYLHECLVLSRKNGKVAGRPEPSSGLAPNHGHKLRKGHGSSTHLPAGGAESSPLSPSGVPVSTPSSTQPDADASASIQQASLSAVPGIKRLAKAVKTFYPEEYAIGSTRANQAAEQAAVENEHYKGKMMSVSSSKKGKGASSGKSGGLLGAFQRVKSKSSAARHSVTGLSTGVAGVLGAGRDTNAERFELVTPWRGE